MASIEGERVNKRKTCRETAGGTTGDTVRPTTHEVCGTCPSLCCRNLSMMIYRPENRAEVEDLKWQLRFDTVKIYIRNNRWYQLIQGKCMYLGDDGRCTEYKGRPNKCRRHNPPDCEFFGRFYDVMISTPDELEAYLDSRRRRKRTSPEHLGRAA
jgi:Fe-S-cluster containining protein